MEPKHSMIVGASIGLLGIAIEIVTGQSLSVMVFVAGAVFGKGYGIWEYKR